MGRGILTKRIQKKAKKFLGREITVTELRLYPYLHYTMMNEQYIKKHQVNCKDYEILSVLRKEGYIKDGTKGLAITRDFWDYINDVLWYSYVVQEAEE